MMREELRESQAEQGFTLVEVIFSMLIFAVMLASVAPILMAQAKKNGQSEIRSGAIGAAQQVLDELRFVDPETMPDSGSDPLRSLEIDGREYSVVSSYCLNSSLCNSPVTRHISVSVFYREKEVFDVETVFTQLR